MARLAIYNGNALVREVDVPEGTLRVGRSDQNDIVLIDPGKAVSRFHAELRIEHGTCAIVDLNSQNGTWVAGRRVQQATLMPGQAVLVGTHRLVFKAEESRQEPVRPASLAEAAQTAAPAPAAFIPEPARHTAAVAPVPPVETTATAPPPSVHAAAARRAVSPRPTAPKPVGRPRRALLLLAASICVAAAGVAGGVFWWPAPGRTAAAPPQTAVQPAPPQAVLGGPPTETPVAPAPLAPAAAPVVETPPAPAPVATAPAAPVGASVAPVKPKRSVPAPTVRKDPAPVAKKGAPEPKPREINPGQLVERARAAIARGDYAAALGFLQPVMRVDAGNPEALDLLAIVRAQGHDAFKRGRQFDALARTPEAIAMYEKAVALLPPDHPSAQTAKERLAALR